MQPTAMMREVEAWVLSFTIFFSRNAPKVENLHICVRCHHAHRKRVDLHERLLEEVSEKIPIFFSERSSAQTPHYACPVNEDAADDDCQGGEKISGPFTFLVDDDKERYEQ